MVGFIKANKRNPSRYDAEERGLYYNWMRHNRIVVEGWRFEAGTGGDVWRISGVVGGKKEGESVCLIFH